MGSNQLLLLEILANGALKIDEAESRLWKHSRALGKPFGFGVEAMDIISGAIQLGDVVTFSDGGKTYLRIPAPFVTLHRIYQDVEYLSYKSHPDAVNGYVRHFEALLSPKGD